MSIERGNDRRAALLTLCFLLFRRTESQTGPFSHPSIKYVTMDYNTASVFCPDFFSSLYDDDRVRSIVADCVGLFVFVDKQRKRNIVGENLG